MQDAVDHHFGILHNIEDKVIAHHHFSVTELKLARLVFFKFVWVFLQRKNRIYKSIVLPQGRTGIKPI